MISLRDHRVTRSLRSDALHFAVVVFVVGGLVLIIAGNMRSWHWVNALWFRLAHIGAIGTVAAESWLGITCPLTTLEIWLRSKAGEAVYTVSFIEHWLQRLIFYDAPPWALALGYSLFGLLVLVTWWYFPPGSKSGYDESRVYSPFVSRFCLTMIASGNRRQGRW